MLPMLLFTPPPTSYFSINRTNKSEAYNCESLAANSRQFTQDIYVSGYISIKLFVLLFDYCTRKKSSAPRTKYASE